MVCGMFPNANFLGLIVVRFYLYKNGSYSVTAKGELDIHGIKQQRTIPATIEVKDKSIKIISKFKVKLADHNIQIPTIVFNKIAEEIDVSMQSDLVKM